MATATQRRRKKRGAQGFPYPFSATVPAPRGCRDLVNVAASGLDDGIMVLMENVYPEDPASDSGVRLRPAFTKLTTGALGRLPLGLGLDHVGQAVFQHTMLDGAEFSLFFGGGRMYQLDWPTGAFTDRTPAGVTISKTATIYCVTFADYLIVSDGENRPWKWNAVTGAASFLTDLAYPVYGPLAVYYGQLFAVKAGARNTLVWSEILDPDAGYENIVYDNVWVLGQSDQEGLEAIAATNTALYFWRGASIGTITGQVTEDFSTQGTRDGVSTRIGTKSPAALFIDDTGIYFVDQFGHPQRLAPGDVVADLSTPAWQTLQGVEKPELARARTILVPGTHVALFALPLSAEVALGSTRPAYAFAFGSDTDLWYGLWSHAARVRFAAWGLLKDRNAASRLVFIDEAGEVYLLDVPEGALTRDDLAPIPATIDVPPVAYDPVLVKDFDEALLLSRGKSVPVTIHFREPGGDGAAAGYDEGQPAGSIGVTLKEKTPVGLAVSGRYMTMRIVSESSDERFTFTGAVVTGNVVSDHPEDT